MNTFHLQNLNFKINIRNYACGKGKVYRYKVITKQETSLIRKTSLVAHQREDFNQFDGPSLQSLK